MNDAEVISQLITNTKTKSREVDLITISDTVSQFVEISGGLSNAANALSISPGMLNQFLIIKKLNPSVKSLIKNKKINSISVAYNLSKFKEDDQEILAKLIISKDINSLDLRLVAPMRKQFPDLEVGQLVNRLLNSKDRKVSVIKFDKEDAPGSVSDIIYRFEKLVGSELLECFEDKNQIVVKVSKEGESLLRKKARANKKTLTEFIYQILR